MMFANLILFTGLKVHPLYPQTNPISLLLITLIVCLAEANATSVFLHRYKTHGALKMNPIVAHAYQIILWLTTGIKTILWVVIHLAHHVTSDKEKDLHSPKNPIKIFGKNITGPVVPIIKYFALYTDAKKVEDRINKRLANEDWIVRNIYHRLSFLGPVILMLLLCALFGLNGIWMTLIIFFYLPIVAGGGINGFGHGHKDPQPDTKGDYSMDLLGFMNRLPKWLYWTFSPMWFSLKLSVNLLTGGEFRHHIHHKVLSSARIALKRWEIDTGWITICCLWILGLVTKVRYYTEFSEEPRYLSL